MNTIHTISFEPSNLTFSFSFSPFAIPNSNEMLALDEFEDNVNIILRKFSVYKTEEITEYIK